MSLRVLTISASFSKWHSNHVDDWFVFAAFSAALKLRFQAINEVRRAG